MQLSRAGVDLWCGGVVFDLKSFDIKWVIASFIDAVEWNKLQD